MRDDIILQKLNAIERYSLLAAKSVLNIDDVSLLTGLSKSYLYRLTSTNQMPYYKPNGKLCYFDKAEVEDWCRQHRIGTKEEAENKAALYNLKKGGSL